MKLFFTSFLAICFFFVAQAQEKKNEGITYFLPKTQLKFVITIEKSTYTPGDCAIYSDLFMKKKADENPQTTYRIVKIDMRETAIPDSLKQHVVAIDKKHTIFSLKLADNGVLTAINAEPKLQETEPAFVPAMKVKAIDPRNYLSADALSAGSLSKMAEVISKDIYDLRENRKMLASGEAEYMPKDGEQLKTMLATLDKTENALMTFFEGSVTKDTLQQVITFTPEQNVPQSLLFRFSKWLGLVDKDDLAGVPHYINIENLNVLPTLTTAVDGDKKAKEDIGLYVNLAGQARISIEGEHGSMPATKVNIAQFGRQEMLSGALFGRKFTSHLVLNPITGNIESLKTEPLE